MPGAGSRPVRTRANPSGQRRPGLSSGLAAVDQSLGAGGVAGRCIWWIPRSGLALGRSRNRPDGMGRPVSKLVLGRGFFRLEG